MKPVVYLLCLAGLMAVFGIPGPAGEEKMVKMQMELFNRDRAFSDLAGRVGLVRAFQAMLDSGGIILPVEGHPIQGLSHLHRIASPIPAGVAEIKIQWTPGVALISRTGDLGFTCGKYRLHKISGSSEERKGYYGSAWVKSPAGCWKLAFSQGLFQLKVGHRYRGLKLKKDLTPAEKSLISVELAFCQYARGQGINRAFYKFISQKGMAVSGEGAPRTRETYRRLVSVQKDHEIHRLEWTPVLSFLSSSNDMGYNSGPYTYTPGGKPIKQRLLKGYFFTLWIRENGRWKFFYDGGNRLPENKSDWNRGRRYPGPKSHKP